MNDLPISDLPQTKIRPIYNQIVVLRDSPPARIGHIILPDITRERLQKEATRGVVLRVGPGTFKRVRDPETREIRNTHERLPMFLRRGDIVWFHHLAGVSGDRMFDIEEHGRRLTIMWDDEVQAMDIDRRGEIEMCDLLVQSAEELIAEDLESSVLRGQ
jgi:hypothetical protein